MVETKLTAKSVNIGLFRRPETRLCMHDDVALSDMSISNSIVFTAGFLSKMAKKDCRFRKLNLANTLKSVPLI